MNWIVKEPAFKWWVSNTLHKQNHIISKVKKKYWQIMHKFGCKLPHSVEEHWRLIGKWGLITGGEL
jgi:hypothetical protein